MIRFVNELVVSKVGSGGRFEVENPFTVDHPLIGELTIPVGFQFDGNSVPRLGWIVSPPSDFLESGCFHDYGYKHGAELGIDRGTVDRVYRDFLGLQGMNKFRRWTRWMAVRGFGWHAYKDGK